MQAIKNRLTVSKITILIIPLTRCIFGYSTSSTIKTVLQTPIISLLLFQLPD